jgi:hyperosmotically inducible periplasmic protein
MKTLISAVVLAAALVSGVSGCAVTRGQETTGEYVDDATITTRVKTRFAKDPTVSAMHIKVDTMKGVVHLSGAAHSEAERKQAVDVAKAVPGVKDVQSDIQLESASTDSNSTNR